MAQISTINQVEQGEHKFAKGAILVSLVDTVSPEFVQYQFQRLGLEILQNHIYPVTGHSTLGLTSSQIEWLSSHPFIQEIIIRESGLTEQKIAELVSGKNSQDSLRMTQSLQSLMSNPTKHIVFKHSITHNMAETFAEQFSEYEIRIQYYNPKSVVVQTIPGKEAETIKKVEELIYVQNTAFIALQSNQ
ncbi:MAG: hypothetical protein MI700_04300 [Balneolales bacterium]|nr:hypothetical protein [Balneolales bacterium]